MLRLAGVKAGYGSIEVLRGLDLQVNQGEIVTLIGANGAGKSTCLMTLSGLVRAAAGSILFQGREIATLPPHEIVALGLVQVPEGRRILARFTVAENLEMGAFLRRDPAQIHREIQGFYERFPLLGQRRAQPAGTLSGGEQQLLALARALLARPRLLMLDEPSLGLAPLMIQQVFALLRELNQTQGLTLLLVEQNAHLALGLAHRAYVLEQGRIVLQGAALELAASEAVKKAYLGLL